MKVLLELFNVKKLKQEKKYLFLLFLVIGGVLAGSLFITILSKTDKTAITSQLLNYFSSVQSNNLNYGAAFYNALLSNVGTVFLIWLLGISIIGLPIIILSVFLSSFVMGFSVGAIIYTVGIKGILSSFIYLFPQKIIFILLLIIISYYAVTLSLTLFNAIIKKKGINFKDYIGKYYFILLCSVLVAFIVSVFEIFITPIFIRSLGFLFRI